jgi:acetyl-CoA carboxylase carboxyl transferase subunit beta
MAVMAWFKKERKPRPAQRERLEIPADAWEKCPDCGHMDIATKFHKSLSVCPECGHHFRFSAEEYIELLTDAGTWRELNASLRVEAAEKKAGRADAIFTGSAKLDGMPVSLGVMNFRFMGGSMGSVVGEKIARLAQRSLDRKVPLILVCTSGGARMQEGVFSLMQMAKTSAFVALLKRAGIPFVTILTDPTTGGVSASFAMQGDVILAEPGAVVGFAGQRVIKQTIGQDLPEGFQTAEFLLEKGQVDAVVPRASLRDTTSRLLRHMVGQKAAQPESAASAAVD